MHSIKLIFTIALVQELPTLFKSKKIPIVTLKALLAGDTRAIDYTSPYLCIITGVGAVNSQAAAEWVISNLDPIAVINLGTAGAHTSLLKQGDIAIPTKFYSDDNKIVESIGYFPLFITQKIVSSRVSTVFLKDQPHPLRIRLILLIKRHIGKRYSFLKKISLLLQLNIYLTIMIKILSQTSIVP